MKKIAALATGLCLLAVVGVFFRNRILPTPAKSEAASATRGTAASERSANHSMAPESHVSGETPTAIDRSPPPARPLRARGTTAIADFELPAAPTGDYELALTPDQVVAIVEKRYGALIRGLSLPPDRLARFRALLVERQQASVDAANASVIVGVNPIRDVAEIQKVIALAQEPIDTALRREFGDALFSNCQEYDRTLGERNAIADFSRSLADSDQLRPEQERQLIQILRTEKPAADVTIDHAIYGATNTRVSINEKAVAAAARVLSPRQLAQFRKMQQP